MKAEFIQNSPILDPERLEENLSRAMDKSLTEFVQEVAVHQITTEHTGVVRNVKINGVVTKHQASRIGESPAPLSGSLVNSTEPEQFSATSGEVRVTAPHGVILVEKLDRDILETPEKNYASRFQENVDQAVKELL